MAILVGWGEGRGLEVEWPSLLLSLGSLHRWSCSLTACRPVASATKMKNNHPQYLCHHTRQIILVIGHVDDKETHREYNLAL